MCAKLSKPFFVVYGKSSIFPIQQKSLNLDFSNLSFFYSILLPYFANNFLSIETIGIVVSGSFTSFPAIVPSAATTGSSP